MANARPTSTLNDPFKLTLLIFAIVAFMYFTAEVLKPLALSILLSFALAPPVRRLVRIGIPRNGGGHSDGGDVARPAGRAGAMSSKSN